MKVFCFLWSRLKECIIKGAVSEQYGSGAKTATILLTYYLFSCLFCFYPQVCKTWGSKFFSLRRYWRHCTETKKLEGLDGGNNGNGVSPTQMTMGLGSIVSCHSRVWSRAPVGKTISVLSRMPLTADFTHFQCNCCIEFYIVSQKSSHLWTLCNFVKS